MHISQITAFLFSFFNGYWWLKPMVSLKLVYYRFSTDCRIGLDSFNTLSYYSREF